MSKIITAPAILTSISYTKDGGMRLGFSTNELSQKDKLTISEFYQTFGWLAFKENAIDVLDMPKEDAEDKLKTPAKRLRNTLYVLATQEGIKKEHFELYYREKMEKIIDFVKNKLDK